MDKSIETLIRMSIEAGSISEEKMQAIRAKADQLGISEGELKIYVDFLIKESKNTVQNQLKNISEKGRDEALKQFKTIQGHLSEKNIGGVSKYIQLIKEGADKRTVKIFAGIVVFVFIFRLMFCGSSFEELDYNEWDRLVKPETKEGICGNYYVYEKNGRPVKGNFAVFSGDRKTLYTIKKGVVVEQIVYSNNGEELDWEATYDKLGREIEHKSFYRKSDKAKEKITSTRVNKRKYLDDDCDDYEISYLKYKGKEKELVVKDVKLDGESTKYYDRKGNEITWEEYSDLQVVD